MKPLAFARAAALAAIAVLLSAAASGNWNTTVVETDGGHRIGNPEAKVRLIEFVSYTCPHCANFARDGDGALQLVYIGSGKTSVEVRHVVRNPVDLTAAVLANCGPAAKFPRNHAAFMLAQDKWLPIAAGATAGQQKRWYTGDGTSRRKAIAGDLGFYEIMLGRGYRRTEIDRCLSDEAAATRIAEVSVRDAKKWGISGTPSFAINGTLLAGTHDWRMLQPQLDARF